MNCTNCGSANTRRNGRDRHGRQRWRCLDCTKISSEGADPSNKGGGCKPKKWGSNAERMRAYRKRKREQENPE